MKQPKRTFCKIYLPRLSYSKTTLQLSPYCPTTYSLPQHHLLPYHLLPYYLVPCYLLLTTAPLTTLSLTTLLLTTLLPTPLQHVLLFFDTQLCFATHKWGINPKYYCNFALYFGTREECLSWFCITKIPHSSKF